MLTLTYYNRTTKKGFKIDLKRFFESLLVLTLITTCMGLYVDFVRFPDKYITTLKYQLKNDIQIGICFVLFGGKSGDMEAITYYNRVYKSNGINLFED